MSCKKPLSTYIKRFQNDGSISLLSYHFVTSLLFINKGATTMYVQTSGDKIPIGANDSLTLGSEDSDTYRVDDVSITFNTGAGDGYVLLNQEPFGYERS